MGIITKQFSKRLKEARETAGLTQAQLANKLNVSRGAISYYENGERTPDIEFLDAFARYFDLPLDFILGYTDNKKREFVDMDLMFSLNDVACEELEEHSGVGDLLSFIFSHEDYNVLREAYEKLAEGPCTLNYNQLGYISFLITDILNRIIHDSLMRIYATQYTPEVQEVLRLNINNTHRRLEVLQYFLAELRKQEK